MQVVLLQEGADLDELSSAYGITLIYQNFKIVLPNSLESKVLKTINLFKEKFKDKVIKKADLNISEVSEVIITDYQEIPFNLSENVKVTIYDHHPKKYQRIPKKAKVHFYKTGSITTAIVEKIRKKKISLDNLDSTILALGIYEDTGGFKYKGTTVRDLNAFRFLVKKGIDLELFYKIIQDKLGEEELDILKDINQNAEILPHSKYKIYISITSKRVKNDIAGLLKYIKSFEDADAFFVILNKRNKKTIIGRSINDNIDVNKVLGYFEGGGHKYAASATVVGVSYEEIKDTIRLILQDEELLSNLIRNDVPIILQNTKFKDLDKKYKYFIVVDNQGKYLGVLKGRYIHLALKHGFEKADISIFLEDWKTLNYSDLRHINIRTLIEEDYEIFPVLDKGFYLGYIHKRDILTQIFKDTEKTSIATLKSSPKIYNVFKKLESFFPKFLIEKLKEIGVIAEKLGYRAFIIGGVVRDIVLNKKNLDIDIIVEGDAPDLIKEFVKKYNYPYHIYKEFMTGNVVIENSIKLDFSTARKEEYESPGAYPKVEKATLFEDLYRRDFTINTLAIEITQSNYGKLIDYFNSLVDIKEKRIRILHSFSFIEDPIRILRALRFAGRLDFKLEKNTEKLLIYCVEKNLIDFAPKGRINLELNLTFNEEKVLNILKLYDKYKVLNKIFPFTHIDGEKERLLQKLADTLILLNQLKPYDYPKNTNYIYILLSHLPTEIIYQTLKKYLFEKESKFLENFIEDYKRLKETKDKFETYKILKSIKDDYLPSILTLLEEKQYNIIIEIFKFEKSPLITGNDLISLGLKPSKLFKTIIEDTLEKQLNGFFKDKTDAINYINEKYIKHFKES